MQVHSSREILSACVTAAQVVKHAGTVLDGLFWPLAIGRRTHHIASDPSTLDQMG